jgi:hypothetical protein
MQLICFLLKVFITVCIHYLCSSSSFFRICVQVWTTKYKFVLIFLFLRVATFYLLNCDEWDRVVALPRHKFVTGATLLQLAVTVKIPSHTIVVYIELAEKYMLFKGSNSLVQIYRSFVITGNYGRRSFSKYGISYYT